MKQNGSFRLGIASVALAGLLVLPAAAGAEVDAKSPVGRWKTIDEQSGKAKSVIRIWEKDGVLMGLIDELILEPGEDPNPLCDKCDGEHKNEPIKGMTILRGFKKDDEKWSGGKIFDPETGKTYKCTIAVVDDGKRLKVRGYIGISLIGRTQYWLRAE